MVGEHFDTLVLNGTVVTESAIVRTNLAIRDGRIREVGNGATWTADNTIDARGLHVFPGAIDPHTHWGTLQDLAGQCRVDSRAAVLGGTTTALVLHRMPPSGHAEAVAVASQHSYVDFAITPAVTTDEHGERIERILEHESLSVKFYLAYRRLDDAPSGDDWNLLTPELFERCLRVMGSRRGAVAYVHAEDAHRINSSMARSPQDAGDGLKQWSQANPQDAEVSAIRYAADVGRRTGATVYFVHLSGRAALSALASVAQGHNKVYAETCPHYLFHTTDSDPIVKFSPPVRDIGDKDALWAALASGAIHCVGSDNSTTTADEKLGSVWTIRRGGPNAGFLLPIMLSEGINKGRISPSLAAAVTSTNAAKIFGLYPRKGAIRRGADADVTLVDMKKRVSVTPELLGGELPYTLYDDARLTGWPIGTMLRGQLICWEGELLHEKPSGMRLQRDFG